jgi:hypothetical protein
MIRVVHPGSRIWILTFYISRIQGSKSHRNPDPDPQHWLKPVDWISGDPEAVRLVGPVGGVPQSEGRPAWCAACPHAPAPARAEHPGTPDPAPEKGDVPVPAPDPLPGGKDASTFVFSPHFLL